MRHESTDELIEQCKKGNVMAQYRLYNNYSKAMYNICIRMIPQKEEAEDLLQEAFLRILKAAPRFKPGGSVASWMYRISANLGYSYWRRKKVSPLLPPGRSGEIIDRPAPSFEGPEERFLAKAFAGEASEAIRRLPPNQRMTFLLKIDQGLTYEEIASVLHCPTGTAKSRFHHAVLKLREELSAWDENQIPHWRNQDVL